MGERGDVGVGGAWISIGLAVVVFDMYIWDFDG